jgi:hypothetical protein
VFAVLSSPFDGALRFSVKLTDDAESRCFPPTLHGSGASARVFVACTPNRVLGFASGAAGSSGVALLNTTVLSAVPLADATFVPHWDGPVLVSSRTVGPTAVELLLVTGSGVLFGLSPVDGSKATSQLGPYDAALFGTEVPSVFAQASMHASDSAEVLLAAQAQRDVDSNVTPAALLRFTIPTAAGGAFTSVTGPNAAVRFGNTSVPSVSFESFVGAQSQRIYVRARHTVGSTSTLPPNTTDELYAFDGVNPDILVRFSCNALTDPVESFGASGVQESIDGAYLTPLSVGTVLPVLSALDGKLVQLYDFRHTNYSALRQAAVLLSADGAEQPVVFLVAPSLLAAALFRPQNTEEAQELQLAWAFDIAAKKPTDASPTTAPQSFVPIMLDNQRANAVLLGAGGGAQTLLIYSSATPKPDQSFLMHGDWLWSIGASYAPRCDALPDSSDCPTCDGFHGVFSARKCAYCSASKKCTEYFLPGLAYLAQNATCADEVYPQSAADGCSRGGPSTLIAVLVGCAVGVVVFFAFAVCYLAKRKKNQQVDDGYQQY